MAGGRPFEIEWKDDEQTLYELYKKERDWQDQKRIQALWLLRKGKRLSEVAEIVGVHYRTVQEWVKWYRQGGIEAVKSHRQGGSGGVKARLEGEELGKLKAKVEQGEFKTIWEAVKWVKDKFEVEYSYWGMRWVFKRLKLKKKYPAPKTLKPRWKSSKRGRRAVYGRNWRKWAIAGVKDYTGRMKCGLV
jgi:transposase